MLCMYVYVSRYFPPTHVDNSFCKSHVCVCTYVCINSEKIIYRHDFLLSLLRSGLRIFSIGVNTFVLENSLSFPVVNVILHPSKQVFLISCMYVCIHLCMVRTVCMYSYGHNFCKIRFLKAIDHEYLYKRCLYEVFYVK
jgi:hypothetical protein